MKILIDNGHGSNTPGKCSPDGRLREYSYTREIAGRVVFELRKLGIDAELVVKEEIDVPLSERCRRVNEYKTSEAILISIHCNPFVAGWRSRASLSSSTMSESLQGVNSTDVSFIEFSCAMASSTCSKRIRILSISLVRFRSTVLRQTKVYLLALDSILVPSIYSTSRLMKPLSARTRTNWVNTLFISSFTRLRKRLIVIKSGCSFPASQI